MEMGSKVLDGYVTSMPSLSNRKKNTKEHLDITLHITPDLPGKFSKMGIPDPHSRTTESEFL